MEKAAGIPNDTAVKFRERLQEAPLTVWQRVKDR
jgi:hypothetical protein